MTWYHASPRDDLEKLGINPRAKPLVSYRTQGWVYFGTLQYLEEQYFKYAPKMTYYIYEVDVSDLPIDDTPLPGDQIRTGAYVSGRYLRQVRTASN